MKLLLFIAPFLTLLSCVSSIDINIANYPDEDLDLNITGVAKTDFAISGSFSWDYTDNGGGNDLGKRLTSDSAGNLYIAGYVTDSGTGYKDAAVWKVDKNGNLDTDFGNSSGIFIYDYADMDDEFKGIKIDPSGDLIVAGYSEDASGYGEMIVMKLSKNGSLKTSFGSSGIYRYSDEDAGASEGERANCLVVTDSGKIFAAGQGAYDDDKSPKIWALSNDGVLDTSFGNAAGIFEHDDIAGGSAADKIYGCALDNSGNILISGLSWGGTSGGRHQAFIGRITSNGVIDTSFATDGFYVTGNIGGGDNIDVFNEVSVDDEGNVYGVGYSYGSLGVNIAFMEKFDDSGSLDTSFANSGTLIIEDSSGSDAYSFTNVFYENEYIYFSGNGSGTTAFGLIGKVDKSGNYDISFGDSGVYIPDFYDSNEKQSILSFNISNRGVLSTCGSLNNGTDSDIFIHQIE